jgi:RNA polymerase sigma-70 factor (ECF subfamily)
MRAKEPAGTEGQALIEASPQQLVEQARRRDASSGGAFGELIGRYEKTALSLAYSIIGEANLAGDVTQEAFLRAWQRLEELNEPQRFAAWLGRIVRNLALDARRSRPRAEAHGSIEDFDPPHECDPSQQVEDQEMSQRIERAMATLDEQTRSAVVLRYYQDLSSRQIGEILDLSAAAVDMRLSRARAELRERLAWANPATNGAQ